MVALLLSALSLPGALPAATAPAPSRTVDNLIAKLPDPNRWSRSPLETALQDPDPIFKDPAFRQLVTSLKGRNPQAVLPSLRTLVVKYPNKPGLQFLRGLFATALRQWPEADASFRNLIGRKDGSPELGWYGLGLLQYAQNRPGEALASLRQAVRLQPRLTEAWFTLALYQIKAGHFDAGADAARHVTQLAPEAADGWAALGWAEVGEKRYGAAIADFQTSLRHANKYIFAYEGLGVCYLQLNRSADAISTFRSVVALQPKNAAAAVQLGYCYMYAGQPAKGERACRQALAIDPRSGKAWYVLGLCYHLEGKSQQAVDAFAHASQLAPPGNKMRRG